MKQTINISIDVSKIDKTELYTSKNGRKYLSLSLLMRDEKDQYGYDGFIVQSISKERRDAGEKGPILGNAKIMDWNTNKPERIKEMLKPENDSDMDEIPF